MGNHVSKASGSTAGGSSITRGAQITSTTYENNTEKMNLSPEQIYEINQQRRSLVSDSNSYLARHDVGDAPRLSEAMQYRYEDYIRGDNDALKGVSTKQLDEMQKRARYDLGTAHERITRTSYDAQLDGYSYQSNFSNGEKWEEAVSNLKNAQRVYDSIKDLQKKRADDWVKRNRKA